MSKKPKNTLSNVNTSKKSVPRSLSYENRGDPRLNKNSRSANHKIFQFLKKEYKNSPDKFKQENLRDFSEVSKIDILKLESFLAYIKLDVPTNLVGLITRSSNYALKNTRLKSADEIIDLFEYSLNKSIKRKIKPLTTWLYEWKLIEEEQYDWVKNAFLKNPEAETRRYIIKKNVDLSDRNPLVIDALRSISRKDEQQMESNSTEKRIYRQAGSEMLADPTKPPTSSVNRLTKAWGIRLPAEAIEAFKESAKKRGVTQAELLLKAIEPYIK